MHETQLFIGCRGDSNPKLREFTGIPGFDFDSDGFPAFCGGEGERPCNLNEHFPSCKSGLNEVPFPGGDCTRLDADGFPPFCGGSGERACNLNEHFPSCKSGLLEVEYNVDFGMLNSLAAPFLPKLSFWFDPDSPGSWIAHRMPLFSKGPTVLVVRSGFTPTQLQAPEARPRY